MDQHQTVSSDSLYNEHTILPEPAWYDQIPRGRPWVPQWNRTCQWCETRLLTNEKLGWCCHRGQYHQQVPILPRYPAEMWHYLYTHAGDTSLFSRKLNNLFAFSSIGVSGGFIHGLGVPSNVAISGRVYHQMRDTAKGEHSMRWFLYDEASRTRQAHDQQIPTAHFNVVNNLIRSVNPYVAHLKHATSRTDSEQPFALELPDDISRGTHG